MRSTGSRLSPRLAAAGLFAAACGLAAPRAQALDPIAVGVVSSEGGAPAFVAQAKGYFAAEGLEAKLVFFTSAAPIAAAAASGDIDFGATAMTAALVNLAHGGSLRIIGSDGWEHPGFHTIGFLVSNQAYAAGVHSFADLKGRSVGITQMGTPLQYDLARVLQKHGLAMSAVRVVPLQSNPNIASAIKGGEIDAAVQTVANVYPLVDRGDARILGWAGDELGAIQTAVTFTTGAMDKAHPEIVGRFLNAFRKASATWDAAFTDAAGNRKDQPSATEMIDIVAQALHQPPKVMASGVGYFDPQARIALANLQDALDWYHEQGMIKTHIDAASLIDQRFALYAK